MGSLLLAAELLRPGYAKSIGFAYITDSDGFLDSDYEAENKIGISLNPSCDFWTD